MAALEIVPTDAKPLNQAEYEQWVADASADEMEIKTALRDARGGLWRAAKALHRFSERSGWLALGYESVGEWLADPEITMTRTTFYRMLTAWQEFAVVRQVDESKLAALDLTKAAITLPALKKGEATVEDVVADVESLAARDLREKYSPQPVAPAPEGDPPSDAISEPLDGSEDGDEPAGEHYDDLDPDAYGTQTVARGIAETLCVVLESVYAELGAPERKRMSQSLREHVVYALELAHAEGLGHD